MKVLVINFPGVAGSSLFAALDQLGFSPYQFNEHVLKTSQFWNKYFGGKIEFENFSTYYNNAEAVMDIPTSAFWKDVYKVYDKKLKVILLLPDSESLWLKSWKKDVVRFRQNLLLGLTLSLTPTGRNINKMLNESYMEITGHHFWSNSLTEEKLLQCYKHFIKDVTKNIPSDQLLIYHVGDEWNILCEFLNVKKPTGEYPYRTQNFSTNLVFSENPLRMKMLVELCFVLAFFILLVAAFSYLIIGDGDFFKLIKYNP